MSFPFSTLASCPSWKTTNSSVVWTVPKLSKKIASLSFWIGIGGAKRFSIEEFQLQIVEFTNAVERHLSLLFGEKIAAAWISDGLAVSGPVLICERNLRCDRLLPYAAS